jgi:CBS domain-containing protein
VDRAEEFIQLFNRVEKFLVQLVSPKKLPPFWQLVDAASERNGAVRAHAEDLKQFAKLRNAIVHDEAYPPHIIAMPSEEAIQRYARVVHEVLEPAPLIPTFNVQVRCFSLSDPLTSALAFMRDHDFSQVVVKTNDRRLSMLTVEGITKWLADNLDGEHSPPGNVMLQSVIALEPPGAFIVMAATKTVFDAVDAFTKSIHCEATRLYAIVITQSGTDTDDPIGLVTPWDLVHNPRLR